MTGPRIYSVRVVDPAALSAWCSTGAGQNIAEARRQLIADTGETVLCLGLPDAARFSWVCPGCGGLAGGELADDAVSGWDAPRWVNTGTRERPTLTPSLGCPGLRHGYCTGHWWLRNGELVPA